MHLTIEDLQIDEPTTTIIWDAEIGNASFVVRVPQSTRIGAKIGDVRVHIDGLEIAKIHFQLWIGKKTAQVHMLRTRGSKHRTAFASYASRDRDEVLARVQGIKKAVPNLQIFLDVLSLRSGSRWRDELLQVIPANDVFYLFWSVNAAQSKWVEMEWRCALLSP